jgi:hypothetical protein
VLIVGANDPCAYRLTVMGTPRAPAAQHERWPVWHSGNGLLAAIIGVTGLAFEARIAADWYTHAIWKPWVLPRGHRFMQ